MPFRVIPFPFIVCVVGAIAIGDAAHADDLSGFYVGAAGGGARLDNDNGRYQTELAAQSSSFGTLVFTQSSLRKDSAAWQVETGYMFWPVVGLEAAYLHFGELRNQLFGTYTQSGGTAQEVFAATKVKSEGPALGLLIRLPLTEHVDANFRVPDYYGKTTLTHVLDVATATVTTQSTKNSSLLVGVGAAFTFAGHWSAKLDYLRVHRAGDGTQAVTYDVDMATLGVSYTF